MELRTFTSLKEMKDTHQKEVNEFGFIFVFAFHEKEFIEKMAAEIQKRKPECTGITTMAGIAKHVTSIGAGAFVFHEDIMAMHKMFNRHEQERKLFNKEEKNLVASILSEMNNHEYAYTRDPYDTLLSLGKTEKDFADERFAKAWKKAKKKCFDAFDKADESGLATYGKWR